MGLSCRTRCVCGACRFGSSEEWDILSLKKKPNPKQKQKTVQKSCKTNMSDSSLRCETKPASSVSCQEQGET